MLLIAYYVPMAKRKKPQPTTTVLSELRWLVLGAGVGAILLPILLWLSGRVLLGRYENGGLIDLWLDFVRELSEGGMSAWILLVAPYAFLQFGRLVWLVHQRLR
jgi:hypothetical protein